LSARPTLTPEELVTLREIGESAGPCGMAMPFAHLATLLKQDFIRAEGDGYAPTAAGIFWIAAEGPQPAV
jgi:hypothetical protein